MDNITLANFFHEIADILELKEENPFRINAYRRAAQVLESLTQNIEEIAQKGKLEEVPGIGEGIAEKIQEILKIGRLRYLEELRKTIPPGLVSMLAVPGLGPKTILRLYHEFGVETIEDLERLLPQHKICQLEGFGERSEEKIKEGLEQFRRHQKRSLLGKVEPLALEIVRTLERVKGVNRVSLAGSLRRKKETIGDIDILCTSDNPKETIAVFCQLPQIKEVKARGTTKVVALSKTGLEIDLRVVEPEAFGAALHYFTGNKQHNIKIRTMGIKRGLKINEYGIFKVEGRGKEGEKEQDKEEAEKNRGTQDEEETQEKSKEGEIKEAVDENEGEGESAAKEGVRIGGATEEEVFRAVGLPYIEPELREDRGEIEAALEGRLPKTINLSDIKGDLHCHTKYSDGHNTIEEVAQAGIERGYEYLLISDHTTTVGITHGMDAEKIQRQMEEIEKVNQRLKEKGVRFRLLKGVECDIKADGSLDLPDEILAQLDLVIAAIHSKFGMDQTERLISACQNPHVDIIAHPTGRKLGERDPYQVDLERVMEVCRKTKTALELNAFWNRLDLSDINCKRAKEIGVKVSIGTDSHHILEMDVMRYGVATAKRGWLEKEDVLNTLSLEELLGWVKNRKKSKE